MFRFSAAPRFRQSAPLLRRGRTCTQVGLAEASESRAKSRPAVPSQGQPCPAAPRPGHPLPSPRSHWNRTPSARKSSPRRDPRLLPSDSVCCRGENAFAAGGTGGIGRRRARGTRKWGTKTLAGRATGPRAGSGGRWRSRKQLCGEGGQRRGPPTPPRLSVPGRCRRPVCAKPLAASGWPCAFVARVRGLCWGFECISACGRPLLPAPAFRRFLLRLRPQVSGCLCRWRGLGLAALGGWRTSRSRGKRRHRCSLGHFTQGGQPGLKG